MTKGESGSYENPPDFVLRNEEFLKEREKRRKETVDKKVSLYSEEKK